MNSHKTTIVVLVTLLACSSFIIGYMINKNFYIKVESKEVVPREINLEGLLPNSKSVNNENRITTEDIHYPADDTISVYEVKKGDTLDIVARLFGVSKKTIMVANHLETENINTGNTLIIPSN